MKLIHSDRNNLKKKKNIYIYIYINKKNEITSLKDNALDCNFHVLLKYKDTFKINFKKRTNSNFAFR